MTRQDLKDGRAKGSRSPWLIGLDAAETGDKQDASGQLNVLPIDDIQTDG